ncbi:hypothetical protein ACIO52_02855 [Nocardia sp. NPDC087230]|uniref:hypothetical protein n=1 Tax=Nocardia sp. NPDC087230 TaxID=3364331 RepID=UPI003802805C
MTNNSSGDWTWICDMCRIELTVEWDDELEQDIGLPAFTAPLPGRVINICDDCAQNRGSHELTELAHTIVDSQGM